MTTRNRLITYTITALLCWGCQEDNLPPQIPVINNVTVTGITDSTALCTFTVTITEAIHSVGINYGTDSSQLTGNISIDDISGNTFTLPLNNLADDMVYYYKVYVRDKMFTFIYSEIGEFKTQFSPYGSTFSNGITPARSFRDGDGTQNNPYLIANAQHLKKLVDDVNGGNECLQTYFKLMTDIEVTADEWIPIGYGRDYHIRPCFDGNFDGNGHTISGTLKSDKYRVFGFFGNLDRNARISNLTIAANVKNVTGDSNTEGSLTGGIAGNNGGEINNCTNTSTVTGGTNTNLVACTGGIAGSNSNSIINCTVSANGMVIGGGGGANFTGGIAGVNWGGRNGNITNCTNNATVSASYSVGGLVGHNDGEIHTSLNTGNITGADYYGNNFTGGLAGGNYKIDYTPHLYSCCTNQGTVNGQAANANNQIGYGKAVESCPDGHSKR